MVSSWVPMSALAGAVLNSLSQHGARVATKSKAAPKPKATGAAKAKAKAHAKRVKLDLAEDVANARMQTQLAKKQLRDKISEAKARGAEADAADG